LIFPCSANRSNQIVHWLITFWSSSGDRLLSQYEPRNRRICSVDAISVLMILVFRTCLFPDQPFVQFGRSTKDIEPSISIDSWLPGVELARPYRWMFYLKLFHAGSSVAPDCVCCLFAPLLGRSFLATRAVNPPVEAELATKSVMVAIHAGHMEFLSPAILD
jgi:hypothetical protein